MYYYLNEKEIKDVVDNNTENLLPHFVLNFSHILRVYYCFELDTDNTV